MGGSDWIHNDNWLQGTTSADFANWYGIEVTNGDVVSLNFYYNGLRGVMPSEISNLKGLQTLVIGVAEMNALPPEIGALTSLKKLHISHTEISELPLEIGNLTNLEYLYVYVNPLGTLPSTLGNLEKLKELDLSLNQLTSLPIEIGGLINLEKLRIHSNLLENLPPTFGNLSSLEYALLDGNQLTSLPAEIGDLKSMISLEIWNNKLSYLPEEIGEMEGLEALTAHDNFLNTLPDNIGGLSGLVTLSLFNNELQALPQEIENLDNLIVLDIGNNQLESLPTTIGGLESLLVLELNSNLLSSLPSTVGNLNSLTNLSCYNNRLTTLPPEIGNLSNLRVLSLAGNKLSSIPPEIGNLKQLRDLSLGNEELTGLPPEIGDLSNLLYFYLYNSQVADLPSDVGDLTNLLKLFLNDNQLTSLPPEIGNLTSLIELRASRNQLTSLPSEINNLANLYRLEVDSNSILVNSLAYFATGSSSFRFNILYRPQTTIIGAPSFRTIATGQTFSFQPFSFSEIHPQTTFQWYHLVNDDWEEIDGETADTFSIFSVSLADSGQYRCRITNDWVSGLTQYSAPITLEVIENPNNEGELSDSLEIEALTTFYNAARGGNWNSNTNWLQGATIDDVATWHGITVSDGDVTSIQLDNNNLSGAISLKINDLISLDQLDIRNNAFTVNAIANYFTGPDTYPVANLLYQPQAETIGESQTLNPSLGDPLVLRAFTNNHPQSRFQWYRKEGGTWTEIAGQTGASYTIASVSSAKAGEYRCRITNDWVSGLEQYSAPITVQVEEPVAVDEGQVPDSLEYAALAALYHATRGDAWLNNDNWLQGSTSEDFASWWGVRVTDGDIDSLILGGNNLNGSVPTAIGSLTELLHLSLEENRIPSLPPAIGRLTNLADLSLSATALASLPFETGNLVSLKNLAVQGNELTTIPDRVVNLSLEQLNVADNELGAIPNFNDHPTLQQLEIGGNKINLNDIAYNRDGPGMADHDFTTFAYAPQAEIIGTARYRFVSEGQDVSLRAFTNNHPQTRFQWYRRAGNTWTALAGETQESYTVSSAAMADAGLYRCKITNDWVSGLTQYSEPITLEITNGPYYSVGSGLWTDAIWALEPGGAPVGTYPQARSEAYIVGHDITVNQPLTTGSVHVIVDRAPSSLTVDGAEMVIYGELDLTKKTEGFPGNVKVVNDGRIVPLAP